MTRWDADTWADDSRLVRNNKEILTKESEMRDKKRKLISGRKTGGTLKGKALVEKLKRMGY
jgi:hypothetical protein